MIEPCIYKIISSNLLTIVSTILLNKNLSNYVVDIKNMNTISEP
jgi:hypothetical protein